MRIAAVRFSARSVLDTMASVALIGAALTLIYRNIVVPYGTAQPEIEVPAEPLEIRGAPMRGAATADTVMLVFSDFQCPFCARFTRDVLPELERRYVSTGRVALVFRHLPLPIHPHAMQAAVLSECAGQQGRFWEMHDRLFKEEQLTEASLADLPGAIGLDVNQLARCVSDDRVSARVRASAAEASALGIRGTPAFFLGKRLEDGRIRIMRAISGARPLQDFVAQLDSTIDGKPTRRSWIPFATLTRW